MTEEQKEGWEQWKKEVEDAEGYCFMPMTLEDGTTIGIDDPRYMDFFQEIIDAQDEEKRNREDDE